MRQPRNRPSSPLSYGALLVSNWPNLISLGRLLSVPLIVWLVTTDQMILAFFTSILAGLSDVVDGFLARILRVTTNVGAYLDPLADKVLLVSLYITLGVKGLVPIWLVLLIGFRDLLILGGTLLLVVLGRKFTVRPLMMSKINTFLQIFTLGWILYRTAFGINSIDLTSILVAGVALTTLVSGIQYLVIGLGYLSQGETS